MLDITGCDSRCQDHAGMARTHCRAQPPDSGLNVVMHVPESPQPGSLKKPHGSLVELPSLYVEVPDDKVGCTGKNGAAGMTWTASKMQQYFNIVYTYCTVVRSMLPMKLHTYLCNVAGMLYHRNLIYTVFLSPQTTCAHVNRYRRITDRKHACHTHLKSACQL